MKKTLVWLRRDLRAHDHASLSYATHNSDEVYAVFVFDKNILDRLEDKRDHRVDLLMRTLLELKQKMPVYILYGEPTEIVVDLAKKLQVQLVATNRDYEPYALERDKKVSSSLKKENIQFVDFKDHVVFEADEIRTGSGDFYRVFTPYKNAWFKKSEEVEDTFSERPVNLKKLAYKKLTSLNEIKCLSDIGFKPTQEKRFVSTNAQKIYKGFLKQIDDYKDKRDLPALDGTSSLSPHLRFGLVSVRELIRGIKDQKSEGAHTWISELVWRDFYSGLLATYPYIEKNAYAKKYENIPWDNDKKLFKKWCEGQTGVPIVDAGMRQLNETGWMHNRVRMIVASYLTKTLICDWRWGEQYFAKKLSDFDLASNNGGWQWSASTGCDAAPYFRVFNPYRQSERFDKDGEYIKRYVPELRELPRKFLHDPSKMNEMEQVMHNCKLDKDYPSPIANYPENRKRVIAMFKEAGES